MKKIVGGLVIYVEYQVITASDSDRLADYVNDCLAAGWEVSGGVSVCPLPTSEHDPFLFAQAITREVLRPS